MSLLDLGASVFPKAPKSPKGKPPQEPPRGPNAPKTKVPSIGGRVGGWFGRALGTIGRFEVIASAVGDANAGLTAARSGKTVEALGDAGSAAVKGGSLLAAEAAGGLVGGMVGGPVGAVAGVAAGVAVVEGGFAAAGKIRDVAAHAQSEHLSLSQIWTKYLDAKARNERTHQTPAPAQTYAPSAEIHRRPGIELP